MTEAEWMACQGLHDVMVDSLPGLSYRKMLLFLSSCLPVVIPTPPCLACQQAIDSWQLKNTDDLATIWRGMSLGFCDHCCDYIFIRHVVINLTEGNLTLRECWNKVVDVSEFANVKLIQAQVQSSPSPERATCIQSLYSRQRDRWCAGLHLLRDILGNPFRPIAIDSAWQTPTVLALAHAAYDNRDLPSGTLDNTLLAILADALEDAGCTNADILNHCRQPGEHYRGCWLVDLLLGKE